MSIPPVSGPSSHQPIKSLPPLVQQFLNLETTWYNLASQSSSPHSKVVQATHDLLHFLEKNQGALDKMAANIPCPFGPRYKESFSETLEAGINNLKSFKDNGYPPNIASAVSEFLYNAIQWAGLAKS